MSLATLALTTSLLAAAPLDVRLPKTELQESGKVARYERNQVLAALYLFSSGRPVVPPGEAPRDPAQPLILLFADGRVVWADGAKPGTWRTGMVPPERAARVAARVQALDADTRAQLTATRMGPDATFQGLFVRLADGRAARMESWHGTAGKNVIATDRGLEALDGRDPAAVLAKQSTEYQRFRTAWQGIEDDLTALTREATAQREVSASFTWDWVKLQRP